MSSLVHSPSEGFWWLFFRTFPACHLCPIKREKCLASLFISLVLDLTIYVDIIFQIHKTGWCLFSYYITIRVPVYFTGFQRELLVSILSAKATRTLL